MYFYRMTSALQLYIFCMQSLGTDPQKDASMQAMLANFLTNLQFGIVKNELFGRWGNGPPLPPNGG